MRFVASAGMMLAAVSWTACATEAVDDGEGSVEVAGIEQPVWKTWSPGGSTSTIVGISRTKDPVGAVVGVSAAIPGSLEPYAWYADGTVCRGQSGSTDVCSTSRSTYAAPGAPSTIVGVGFAVDTGHVYAWYSDNTYSQGTAKDLSAYHGKLAFTRPLRPDGSVFAMTDLVEVDNSPNGEWYFYWKQGSTLYRTTGPSNNGSGYSGRAQVNYPNNHGDIVGISFFGKSIETWYADGARNVSSTSVNLSEP